MIIYLLEVHLENKFATLDCAKSQYHNTLYFHIKFFKHDVESIFQAKSVFKNVSKSEWDCHAYGNINSLHCRLLSLYSSFATFMLQTVKTDSSLAHYNGHCTFHQNCARNNTILSLSYYIRKRSPFASWKKSDC